MWGREGVSQPVYVRTYVQYMTRSQGLDGGEEAQTLNMVCDVSQEAADDLIRAGLGEREREPGVMEREGSGTSRATIG